MDWEVIGSYIIMGSIIIVIYLAFKIVNDVVDMTIKMFNNLNKPEPNRKKHFKNVNEMFQLSDAACLFGFAGYDKHKPILKNDLIKRYRIKAKQVHPDCGGSAEEFIRIKQAYDVLLSRSI